MQRPVVAACRRRSARWGKFEGYYFYRDDFVRLKMLTFTVHRQAVPELLSRFK